VFASLGVWDLVSTLVVGARIGNAAFLPYFIFFPEEMKEQSGDYGVRSRSTKFRLLTFSSNKLLVEKRFDAE
jgi:hypothetical protein